MQVTETLSDGLRRQLKIVVAAKELGERFDKRINEIKSRANIKGFRPGKVPASYLKKVYGRSLMVEVMQETVNETSRKVLEDRAERAAFGPQIKLGDDDKEKIEKVVSGQADLDYDMTFEVIPKFQVTDLATLSIERPVAEPDETDIETNFKNIIDANRPFVAAPDHAAQKGDRVTIDFVGRIDGEAFEGGTATDAPIVLGSGGFIPGFEEGLESVKVGDTRTVEASFPETYAVDTLRGKRAVFEVTVKEVARPDAHADENELAKRTGLESSDALKAFLRERLQAELARMSRTRAKRAILDRLDETHNFDLPPTLVENEFKDIWGQLIRNLEAAKKTFADEGKSEEAERAVYQKLSERRVRLGLVLSEIGEKNAITVTEEELTQALQQQVRQYPGQEREIYRIYRENPSLLVNLRAPIFEEKVVDFVLSKVQITDRKVTSKELMELDRVDDDEGPLVRAGAGDTLDHDHHGHDRGTSEKD